MRAWRENTDLSLTLDDFEGCQCYIGIEPASKTDLAAIVLLFPETDDDGTLT
jgi:phage terminase large subunit-like protein